MNNKPTIRRGGEEGAVAAEFAITLSALMLLIFGAIQFALVYWNWNTMLLAAEEAGRFTMLYNSATLNALGTTLATVCPTGAASVTPGDCAVAWANENWGNMYTVTWSSSTDTDGHTTYTFTACFPPGMTSCGSGTFNFLDPFSLSRAVQVPAI